MATINRPMRRTALALVCGIAAALALSHASGAAEGDKTYVMKLSTATLNDSQHEWMKMFAAAVEKGSGGRIKGEIYPASQLGAIPRQIEGTQLGSIQGWVGPPEFLVGVDERFEVLSAPGIFTSFDQAERITADPEVKDMILGFGVPKGLLGVSLFISGPSAINTRTPIRHLADAKGMKLRVLASPFQNELVYRLGGTPVAMTLADVLPAIQQGTIDGAVSTVPVFTALQYYDAAKYMTETGQPFVFSIATISKKWYDGLSPDLQKVVMDAGVASAKEIVPWQLDFYTKQRKVWTEKGGELISLPPDEQAQMMDKLKSVGEDMSKTKPGLHAAYETVVAALKRIK